MRTVLALAISLFVAAVVLACVFWAGVDGAGPVALALAGLSVAAGVPVWMERLNNWGVPGDEPTFGWLAAARGRSKAH